MNNLTKMAIKRREDVLKRIEQNALQLEELADELAFVEAVILKDIGPCPYCQNHHYPHCKDKVNKQLG